jgi:hypothetical protein
MRSWSKSVTPLAPQDRHSCSRATRSAKNLNRASCEIGCVAHRDFGCGRLCSRVVGSGGIVADNPAGAAGASSGDGGPKAETQLVSSSGCTRLKGAFLFSWKLENLLSQRKGLGQVGSKAESCSRRVKATPSSQSQRHLWCSGPPTRMDPASWSSTRLDGLYSCVTVLTPFPAGVQQLLSVAAVARPWCGLPAGHGGQS